MIDVNYAEVFCCLLIKTFLVKRRWLPVSKPVEPSRPERLGVAEMVLDLLVYRDREVGGKISSEDGFAHLSW